jgi:subtilisin family serine protease
MKQLRWVVAAAVVGALLALPATAGAFGRPVPDRYVVVLEDSASVTAVTRAHEALGVELGHTYRHALKGYSATIPDAVVDNVKADPLVAYVVQDREGSPIAAQTFPTGPDRIDADLGVQLANDGQGETPGDVAVFDTGIQSTHPDLNVAGGVNCVGPVDPYNDGTYNDAHGHGTHVAGIIGAKDDAEGVVGSAPGVRLWSVRVLNSLAVGSISSQICGIDWVTANGPSLGIRVVNSSMRSYTTGDDGDCGQTANNPVHQAICASTAAGILWVFSVGNNNTDFGTQGGANYDQVLAVTAAADANGRPDVGSTATFTCQGPLQGRKRTTYASEVDDRHGSYSNYATSAEDQAHTIAAPGSCIYSTYKNSSYEFMSGTSMAAPSAAASAHLCIVSGRCAGTPAETIQRLRADAEAYSAANPSWGFTGDLLRPVSGRYYGPLVRSGLY